MATMGAEHLREIRPGRWRYVGIQDTPKGTLTRTIEWDHEPLPDELEYARTYDASEHEGVSHARVIGPFLFVKDVSPPPWRWPKAFVKFRPFSVGIGWRMTAYKFGRR